MMNDAAVSSHSVDLMQPLCIGTIRIPPVTQFQWVEKIHHGNSISVPRYQCTLCHRWFSLNHPLDHFKREHGLKLTSSIEVPGLFHDAVTAARKRLPLPSMHDNPSSLSLHTSKDCTTTDLINDENDSADLENHSSHSTVTSDSGNSAFQSDVASSDMFPTELESSFATSGLDVQSLEALQAYAILLSAESEISAMTDPKSKIFPLKEVCQLSQSPVSQYHESQESVLHQKCVPKSPQMSQTVCVHSGTPTLHNLDKKVLMKSSPDSNERTDLKRAALSPELNTSSPVVSEKEGVEKMKQKKAKIDASKIDVNTASCCPKKVQTDTMEMAMPTKKQMDSAEAENRSGGVTDAGVSSNSLKLNALSSAKSAKTAMTSPEKKSGTDQTEIDGEQTKQSIAKRKEKRRTTTTTRTVKTTHEYDKDFMTWFGEPDNQNNAINEKTKKKVNSQATTEPILTNDAKSSDHEKTGNPTRHLMDKESQRVTGCLDVCLSYQNKVLQDLTFIHSIVSHLQNIQNSINQYNHEMQQLSNLLSSSLSNSDQPPIGHHIVLETVQKFLNDNKLTSLESTFNCPNSSLNFSSADFLKSFLSHTVVPPTVFNSLHNKEDLDATGNDLIGLKDLLILDTTTPLTTPTHCSTEQPQSEIVVTTSTCASDPNVVDQEMDPVMQCCCTSPNLIDSKIISNNSNNSSNFRIVLQNSNFDEIKKKKK